ncbi:hypothetical protein [Streptomyces sp. NPDC004291]
MSTAEPVDAAIAKHDRDRVEQRRRLLSAWLVMYSVSGGRPTRSPLRPRPASGGAVWPLDTARLASVYLARLHIAAIGTLTVTLADIDPGARVGLSPATVEDTKVLGQIARQKKSSPPPRETRPVRMK